MELIGRFPNDGDRHDMLELGTLTGKDAGLAEVKVIWKKSYERRLVFYFDNPPELWDLWTEVRHHPRLRNARFFLGSNDFDEELGLEDGGGVPGTHIADDSAMLMDVQPGYRDDWFMALLPHSDHGEKIEKVTSNIMEGKLFDIKWDGYILQQGRERLAVHRGKAKYPSLSSPNHWSEYMDRNGWDPAVYPEYISPNSRFFDDCVSVGLSQSEDESEGESEEDSDGEIELEEDESEGEGQDDLIEEDDDSGP
ncbi:hypothetical protein M409DRAFT_53095 [Zasmidium cellare ATCC 36951]|uniref:Uncharacterized protein n=1 Tax=Zasmidium cellare ATCC 36951 TaxID=1080233 RepID=A0A6A6CME0_ZASCE|nr:uncharacterized protein M409DRAFT_53095 [Zasmidium cellare ATCC 36951]KAF2168407.1 hypothetical protein M409DRAFT_53095 [Zasmidium cellare ATCC 36951]